MQHLLALFLHVAHIGPGGEDLLVEGRYSTFQVQRGFLAGSHRTHFPHQSNAVAAEAAGGMRCAWITSEKNGFWSKDFAYTYGNHRCRTMNCWCFQVFQGRTGTTAGELVSERNTLQLTSDGLEEGPVDLDAGLAVWCNRIWKTGFKLREPSNKTNKYGASSKTYCLSLLAAPCSVIIQIVSQSFVFAHSVCCTAKWGTSHSRKVKRLNGCWYREREHHGVVRTH